MEGEQAQQRMLQDQARLQVAQQYREQTTDLARQRLKEAQQSDGPESRTPLSSSRGSNASSSASRRVRTPFRCTCRKGALVPPRQSALSNVVRRHRCRRTSSLEIFVDPETGARIPSNPATGAFHVEQINREYGAPSQKLSRYRTMATEHANNAAGQEPTRAA